MIISSGITVCNGVIDAFHRGTRVVLDVVRAPFSSNDTSISLIYNSPASFVITNVFLAIVGTVCAYRTKQTLDEEATLFNVKEFGGATLDFDDYRKLVSRCFPVYVVALFTLPVSFVNGIRYIKG